MLCWISLWLYCHFMLTTVTEGARWLHWNSISLWAQNFNRQRGLGFQYVIFLSLFISLIYFHPWETSSKIRESKTILANCLLQCSIPEKCMCATLHHAKLLCTTLCPGIWQSVAAPGALTHWHCPRGDLANLPCLEWKYVMKLHWSAAMLVWHCCSWAKALTLTLSLSFFFLYSLISVYQTWL